jgi:hypothetical protein
VRLEIAGAVEHVCSQLALVEIGLQGAAIVVVTWVPTTGASPSGARARKPSTPRRRATSSMSGLRPRFSWMTTTAENGPVPLGCTRQPRIVPDVPPGERPLAQEIRADPSVRDSTRRRDQRRAGRSQSGSSLFLGRRRLAFAHPTVRALAHSSSQSRFSLARRALKVAPQAYAAGSPMARSYLAAPPTAG